MIGGFSLPHDIRTTERYATDQPENEGDQHEDEDGLKCDVLHRTGLPPLRNDHVGRGHSPERAMTPESIVKIVTRTQLQSYSDPFLFAAQYHGKSLLIL